MCIFCDENDPNPDQCAYASTCCECGKKFFGYGYGATEYPCPDCRMSPTQKIAKKFLAERRAKGEYWASEREYAIMAFSLWLDTADKEQKQT